MSPTVPQNTIDPLGAFIAGGFARIRTAARPDWSTIQIVSADGFVLEKRPMPLGRPGSMC
jgi:hypothetical protein